MLKTLTLNFKAIYKKKMFIDPTNGSQELLLIWQIFTDLISVSILLQWKTKLQRANVSAASSGFILLSCLRGS